MSDTVDKLVQARHQIVLCQRAHPTAGTPAGAALSLLDEVINELSPKPAAGSEPEVHSLHPKSEPLFREDVT